MATSKGEQTMCPFCIASVGLIVAGAVSTGGLATLAMKASEKKHDSSRVIENLNERSSQHVDQ
jgi:hypothetical protein